MILAVNEINAKIDSLLFGSPCSVLFNIYCTVGLFTYQLAVYDAATSIGFIITGIPSNDAIRTQVVRMYADFVSEVDPKGGIMDRLLQEEVVTFELKDRVLAETTRQERCRKLLDVLFASSNPRAFVALREALVGERKTWIVDRIDAAHVTPTDATFSATANGRYQTLQCLTPR